MAQPPSRTVLALPQPDEADTILRTLVTLVGPLARILPEAEVAVHDLRRLPQSIVAIAGGMSGRPIGGEAADHIVEAIAQGDTTSHIGQVWRAPSGREIVSSTIIVPSQDGEPVAALAMSFDPRLWQSLATIALALLPREETTPADLEVEPAAAVDALAEDVLATAMAATGVPVALMQKRHKVAVVKDLKQRGFFALRESVERAAQALGVTRFTIYNYLKEV
jgi:predicted transcriptional regulator YheO